MRRTLKQGSVAHALSTSSYRSDHLSPSALALAVLLHAAVAAALKTAGDDADASKLIRFGLKELAR